MKVLQVVPKTGIKHSLKAQLKAKERELRESGRATAFRRKREGVWVHARYPGWIKWDEARGGLLIGEVHPGRDGSDWQLANAFVGYLDRHFGEHLESISILYR